MRSRKYFLKKKILKNVNVKTNIVMFKCVLFT